MLNGDGVVILECTNTSEPDRKRTHTIRPLAPFAIHETCDRLGIPSTVINYVDFWEPEPLCELLLEWISNNNIKEPVIACSSLFNSHLLSNGNIPTLLKLLKDRLPNSKLVLGGPINASDYTVNNLWPDAVFQGRSLHLFEQWLTNKDFSEHCESIRGVPVYHNKTSQVTEDPYVPRLYDDYCLRSSDLIHFETRLGCKFNCTFCTFEFRNAKKVNDATSEKLYTLFSEAQALGINHFSCVDDTFNEDQEKIQTLYNAVKQLDRKPHIVGYNRFDLMMHYVEQVDLLDACGFHGHYFGIETLHRDASRLIRKSLHKDRAFDFLRMLRDYYSHWYVCSGYIIGIPGEPVSHVNSVMQTVRNEKLLDSVIPVPLGLYKIPGNEHNFSDFSRYPEKYGITVLGGDKKDIDWTHHTMNKQQATLLAKQTASKNNAAGVVAVDPWEWQARRILENNLHWRNASANHIESYKTEKINFLRRS